ncbi:MAG: phosphohydrolase [Candidatus Dadabacteria bacterium]|nr:phosphohydrolase [Candidatus Dadabacteria bacterium]
MLNPWITTYTGKKFHIFNPVTEEVDIEDIAHALGMQTRFNGHGKHFYSVAQHCIMVSLLVPQHLKFAALLHDAAEAYIGDIVAPLKHSLTIIQPIESRIMEVIGRKFGVTYDELNDPMLKALDRSMALSEAQFLGIEFEGWYEADTVKPISNLKLQNALPPEEAKSLYLETFEDLTKQPEPI